MAAGLGDIQKQQRPDQNSIKAFSSQNSRVDADYGSSDHSEEQTSEQKILSVRREHAYFLTRSRQNRYCDGIEPTPDFKSEFAQFHSRESQNRANTGFSNSKNLYAAVESATSENIPITSDLLLDTPSSTDEISEIEHSPQNRYSLGDFTYKVALKELTDIIFDGTNAAIDKLYTVQDHILKYVTDIGQLSQILDFKKNCAAIKNICLTMPLSDLFDIIKQRIEYLKLQNITKTPNTLPKAPTETKHKDDSVNSRDKYPSMVMDIREHIGLFDKAISNNELEQCSDQLLTIIEFIDNCNSQTILDEFTMKIMQLFDSLDNHKLSFKVLSFLTKAKQELQVSQSKKVQKIKFELTAQFREYVLLIVKQAHSRNIEFYQTTLTTIQKLCDDIINRLNAETLSYFEKIIDWIYSNQHLKNLRCTLEQVELNKLEIQQQHLLAAMMSTQLSNINTPVSAPFKSSSFMNKNIFADLWGTIPFAFMESIPTDENRLQFVAVRKSYADPESGVAVRVSRTNHSEFEKYFEDTKHYAEQTYQVKDLNDNHAALCRPVTFIWQGCPILLHRKVKDEEMILILDSKKISPLFIYKKNAETFKFNNRTFSDVKKMANERSNRCRCKCLTNLNALNWKMEELTVRQCSMEKTLQTSGHYLSTTDQWTIPQTLSSTKYNRFSQEQYIEHNEVVVSPIPPTHVLGSMHFINLGSFTAGQSIYPSLISSMLKHYNFVRKFSKFDSGRKYLFAIYSPRHAKLIHVDYLELLLPLGTPGVSVIDQLRALPQELNKFQAILRKINVSSNHIESLLLLTSLKYQLQFLLNLYSVPRITDKTKLSDVLWSYVFSNQLSLTAPNELDLSIQQLIDYFYYLPTSISETLECISNSSFAFDLSGYRKPEHGAITAICCMWLCQLFELQGVVFSEQEKHLLIYTSIFMQTAQGKKLNTTDTVILWRKNFERYFSQKIIEPFESILKQSITNDNSRLQLFDFIIKISVGVPVNWSKQDTSSLLITDDICTGLCDSNQFAKVAFEQDDFKSSFSECIHGTIDLMETLGFELNDDCRTRDFFCNRFENLKKFNASFRQNKTTNIRTVGCLWDTCLKQIKENAARQLCKDSGFAETNYSQLKMVKFPPSFNLVDLLMINSKCVEYQEKLKPLKALISHDGLPKPTINITHLDWNNMESRKYSHDQFAQEKSRFDELESFSSYSKSKQEKSEFKYHQQFLYEFLSS